ncbi:MAG: rod shape-determining protein MreC [Chromatiales bacterium]|nr:rod shape-determining protein MreC [Chromatiales bacterium]
MNTIFTEGPFLALRLGAAVLASVLLMTVDHRLNHLENLRAYLSVIVYPIQLLVDLPNSGSHWVSETLTARRVLIDENAELRQDLLLQQARLQKLSALEAENARLRELLESSLKVSDRVLISEILAVDLDPYRHQVMINKGTNDGVFPGQPVLDATGVMGQVSHVGPASSSVILITDPSHAIPVQVNRTGLRTIAVGTGSSDRLELPHLPNNADIQVGDLLISSGLGGRFPPDYPVARVIQARSDPGRPFAAVIAQPTAQLDRSRELLLVWSETPDSPPVRETDGLDEDIPPEAGEDTELTEQ